MKHKTPAQERLGLRIHAWSFLGAMLLMIAVNIVTGPPYWVVRVLPGWAVGLFCHWYFTQRRRTAHS